MATLAELLTARYAEPAPTKPLFAVGQVVRVIRGVSNDGQTHHSWNGAIAVVVRRYTTGLSKEHRYVITNKATAATDDFGQRELDHRYVRKSVK